MAENDDAVGAPIEEDIRYDDTEYNPAIEPKKAKAWLNLLRESEEAFEAWNERCDKIDRDYGNVEYLGDGTRGRQFQMFWANMEVIRPSIYFKAPNPVVVTKFKDRNPVYQAAAEMLERCCDVSFDIANINELLMQVRDDVAITGRGVAWCRYESGKDGGYYDHEKVCIDFKHRRDFLHSISRSWREVWWVAAASYLTRSEAHKRFKDYSDDEYQDAEYKVDKDAKEVGGADNRERAKFWEIWDKKHRRVVWVAEGCENILDEDDAHLDLRDFFPCPKPAYGTMQRGSLVPVPDVMQYQDQLNEVNDLTDRIHALSGALEAKGFYPAGGAELAEAIQTAKATHTPGVVMVPISNWAAFGGSKEVIIWLPVTDIAAVIKECVGLRQQIIQDIYQIMGLSDIMRGATDPRETAQAQALKTQYGSSRIRDKQYEMVRIAKDLVAITAEIITEKFDKVTIIEMSQTQVPTKRMQEDQARKVQQSMYQGMQMLQQQIPQAAMQPMMPQVPDQGQPPPDPAQQQQQIRDQMQQLQQAAEQQIRKILSKPNIEQVFNVLDDERTRCFVFDIETDSTIQVDENAEKQARAEYTAVLSQLLPQLTQMIMAEPKTTTFAGEALKFSVAPYRAGRAMDGAIDDLVEVMQGKAEQPRGDDPATVQAKTAKEIESMKIEYQKQKDQGENALKAIELQQKDAHAKLKLENQKQIEFMKLQASGADNQAKAQQVNLKAMADREKHQADMIKQASDIKLAQQKADLAVEQSNMKRNDMIARQQERQAAQQFRQLGAATRQFPGGPNGP